MDRRSFGKLLAGTVTVAGIPRVSSAEEKTSLRSRESSVTEIPPSGGANSWELVVLAVAPRIYWLLRADLPSIER